MAIQLVPELRDELIHIEEGVFTGFEEKELNLNGRWNWRLVIRGMWEQNIMMKLCKIFI